MTEDYERLLDLATSACHNAEVFGVESNRRHIEFETNRPKNIGQSQSSGIALRIINQNGRIGFSSTSDADKFDELVDRAAALADFGAKAEFEFPEASNYPAVASVDDAVADLTDAEMLDFGRGAVDAILDEFPEALCSVDLSKSSGRQRLVNTAGVDAGYSRTSCSFYVGVELIRDTDMLSIWEGTVSTSPIDQGQVDLIVLKLLSKLRNSQNIVDSPSGSDLPVLFSPVGFNGTFLPPLLSGFNGKNVATGASPLIDNWGEKKLDERISIADDPLHPSTPVARPMDDEGVPARRLDFVRAGIIGEPFLDLQTAGEIGKSSTGCGMRGITTTPSPSTSYIIMAGGDTPNDAMFEGVEQGILVEQLLGAGQGNELGGDFRANLSLGFLIEKGEVVGRVKDTMISGNVYEALNRVEAISRTPEIVWGTRELPWVRTRGVEVATAS
jgi:PmbA protein